MTETIYHLEKTKSMFSSFAMVLHTNEKSVVFLIYKQFLQELFQNRTRILDLRKIDSIKNGLVEKTRPKSLKTLPFVSCHKKDNVELIKFQVKIRGLQGVIFL